jgi:hypothetical protein
VGAAGSGAQLPLAGPDTTGPEPIAPEQLPRAGRPIHHSAADPAGSPAAAADDPSSYPRHAAAGAYPDFVREPAYGAYRPAEQQLLRLLQTPDLDQAVQRQPALTALFDRAVERALAAAFGEQEQAQEEEAGGGRAVLGARDAAHLFLQRVLYRWGRRAAGGARPAGHEGAACLNRLGSLVAAQCCPACRHDLTARPCHAFRPCPRRACCLLPPGSTG